MVLTEVAPKATRNAEEQFPKGKRDTDSGPRSRGEGRLGRSKDKATDRRRVLYALSDSLDLILRLWKPLRGLKQGSSFTKCMLPKTPVV